jgi:carboxymethylenebutenolidase
LYSLSSLKQQSFPSKDCFYFVITKPILVSEFITLAVKDAPEMRAYVAQPHAGSSHPAVIVLQEAFGVNNHIRDVADRIAGEGYVAIAPELFHRTAPAGLEISYADFAPAMLHMQAITADGLENDLQATYNWLQQQDYVQKESIASIGFCLGGRVSFVANTFLPLKAGISFYGGGTHNLLDRAANLQSPHLFFWGGKDQHIKAEHIARINDAVTAAGKDYINVQISYADHGFFCNERAAYNAKAAQEAWELTKAFLKNNL